MNLRNFYAIVCALMCAFAVACSQPSEPLPLPEAQATSEPGAATRAGQTIVIDEYTTLELSPGTVLSAAEEDYFTKPIVGPAWAATAQEEAYSIPPGKPSGVNLTNWQVIVGSSYSIRGGTNSPTLFITFNSQIAYTLRANFTLPSGVAWLNKIVTVDNIPEITALTWQAASTPGNPSPGNYAYVTAVGQLENTTIEWIRGQGCDPYGGWVIDNYSRAFMVASNYEGQYMTISCRASRKDGVWGNTAILHIPVAQPYLAPAPLIVEELESELAE